MTRRPIILMVLILATGILCAQTPADAKPYLGQRPPGTTPRVFAPRVVSTGNLHSRLAISPDGREMFWSTVDMTTFSTRLLSVREVGGRWTEPQTPPFAREGSAQSPMFPPDGRKLYFRIRAEKGWTTAFVEKLASGWSAPRTDGVGSTVARRSRGRAGPTSRRR